VRLVRLQEVVLQARAARELVDGAPAKIEEIESRFRERNAEYVAVQQRYDALDQDPRTRPSELASIEVQRQKYAADLMQVQNQREYAAMLKEIDTVKSQIAEHEEAILKDMTEIEQVKVELATHEDHIRAERQRVAEEHAGVDASVASARARIAELDKERARIESELPDPLVGSVRRLEESRAGQFLSRAVDGVCQSCYVRVRPQGFQEIKLALKLHFCSNCRRLLFHEASLVAPPVAEGASPAEAPRPERVEAVDGGAV
jgi:predicted  nucleic acid-binding Zn-ribbon protein